MHAFAPVEPYLGDQPGQAYGEILAAIKKLEARHKEHIDAYGEGNERRLTGAHDSGSNLLPGDLYTESGQTLQGSFSAVSKPIFAAKYSSE